MIELGKIQKLVVDRDTSVGMYLFSKDDPGHDGILIPKKYIPTGTGIGDEIEVFVYKDSDDRLIATTLIPKLVLGEIAFLKVAQITEFGAFLDWGLEKDLLLPFGEQTIVISEGEKYLVALYIDNTERLCATMDIYKMLSSNSPYNVNDKIVGTIYDIKDDMGAFVAIDNKYQGLIPKNELFGDYIYGDEIEGRVTKVREDGKLNISVREKAYIQMDKDAQTIFETLIDNDGFLNLNDKSSIDEIKIYLKMSKNAFKRAVGRLLKEKTIKFYEGGIQLLKK